MKAWTVGCICPLVLQIYMCNAKRKYLCCNVLWYIEVALFLYTSQAFSSWTPSTSAYSSNSSIKPSSGVCWWLCWFPSWILPVSSSVSNTNHSKAWSVISSLNMLTLRIAELAFVYTQIKWQLTISVIAARKFHNSAVLNQVKGYVSATQDDLGMNC